MTTSPLARFSFKNLPPFDGQVVHKGAGPEIDHQATVAANLKAARAYFEAAGSAVRGGMKDLFAKDTRWAERPHIFFRMLVFSGIEVLGGVKDSFDAAMHSVMG